MKLYMPKMVNLWSDTISSVGLPVSINDSSIGFIPVFEDYDQCRKEYPKAQIQTMETKIDIKEIKK